MSLIMWWYSWGAFLALFIAIGVIFWTVYDSRVREIRATGWIMLSILSAILILPSTLYFLIVSAAYGVIVPTPPPPPPPLGDLQESFFWMGLVGGAMAVVLAVAYAINAPKEEELAMQRREAERAAQLERERLAAQPLAPPRRPQPEPSQPPVMPPPRPKKQPANAMLTATINGQMRQFPLYQGETTVGRRTDNDIVIAWDDECGRQQAWIREDNGRFFLINLGGTNPTLLNGRPVRREEMLHDRDVIAVGQTELTFVQL